MSTQPHPMNTQDLVGRLNERWERMDGAAARKISRILAERKEAASRIEALEAENAGLRKPDRDAMANRSEEEWEAIEDAIMTVYGLREGHTLTAGDIAALNLVDRTHRDDEEGATEAYHRGLENGLRERGGDELVDLERRVSEAIVARTTEKAMRAFAEARANQAEFLLALMTACAENNAGWAYEFRRMLIARVEKDTAERSQAAHYRTEEQGEEER